MDDYIKRSDAVEDIRGLVDTMSVCVSMDECNGMRSLKERALTALERIPAADVRPVVCCKDCIYDDNCFSQSIFEEMSRIPFDKNRFFCADGKRREGGDDE